MAALSIFIASFTIALSGALMPGPLLAAVLYQSARHGFVTGPLMILGHAIVELAMVLCIIFGLTYIVDNPLIIKGISLLGAVILIYFGIAMIVSVPKVTLDIEEQDTSSSNLILSGITMSIANPYWTIWWLTIGLGLVIAAGDVGMWAVIMFFLGHILADLLWYSFISLMVSRGKRFVSLGVYRSVIVVCACALLGFGMYFGLHSLDVL